MSHTLHIKVVEARNLKAADLNGFSDPYAKILIHDKKEIKTKIVKKTLNPKWDEIFHIDAVPEKGEFVIHVFDWDLIGTDDFLGSAKIEYSPATHSKAKAKWYPVTDENGASGDIHLVMQVTPRGFQADLDSLDASKNRLTVSEVKEGSGQLLVEVVKASNLPAKDLNGLSDPFCVLTVDKQEYKTNILEKTLNPMWHEEFYFELSPISSTLVIEVWDWDLVTSHDRMGMVTINLKDLQNEELHVGSYKLLASRKEKVSGELFLRLQYTSPANAQKYRKIAKQEYPKLVKILVAGDVALAVNLLQIYESHELAKAMVLLFSSESKAADFFHECFEREVTKTSSENTLFRTDSPSTKSAVAYLKLVDSATGYLKNTLSAMINLVQKEPLKYEIDMEKVSKDVRHKNLKNLMEISQKFLDAIFASQARMPPQFFELLYVLRSVVSRKFPEAAIKTVGAIFFLRFVCPAIFSPEAYGLVAAVPSTDYRRALTLIAKTLQNLANGVQFGMKEQSMAEINPYLIANQPKIAQLFDFISKVPKAYERMQFNEEEKTTSMGLVVKNLRGNFAKVQALTLADHRISENPAKAAELKLQVEEISAILAEY